MDSAAVDRRSMRRNWRSLPYSLTRSGVVRKNTRYGEPDTVMEQLDSISFRIEQALKI